MNTPIEDMLSQVSSKDEILRHLRGHMRRRSPVMLIVDCANAPMQAHIQSADSDSDTFTVMCLDNTTVPANATGRYAIVGTTADGCKFLASGQFWINAHAPQNMKLALPHWIDVSQTRDSFRSTVPTGYVLHISHPDPHQNDQVCRIKDISMGGIAVEWLEEKNGPPPVTGQITEAALMYTFERWISVGQLRVAHRSTGDKSAVLGLCFEHDTPRDFAPMVLNMQRRKIR